MISPAVPAPVVAAPKLQTPGGAPPTAALFQMDQRKVRSAGALGTLSPLFFCSSVRHIFAARLPLNAAALVLLKVPLSLSLSHWTSTQAGAQAQRRVLLLFSSLWVPKSHSLSFAALSSPSPFSLTFRRSRGQRSRIRSVQKQAKQQKEKEKLREKTSVSVYSLPLTHSVSVPSTAAAVAVAVLSVVACRSSTPPPKSAAAVAVVDSCRTHDADTQKPRSPELGWAELNWTELNWRKRRNPKHLFQTEKWTRKARQLVLPIALSPSLLVLPLIICFFKLWLPLACFNKQIQLALCVCVTYRWSHPINFARWVCSNLFSAFVQCFETGSTHSAALLRSTRLSSSLRSEFSCLITVLFISGAIYNCFSSGIAFYYCHNSVSAENSAGQ